MSENRVHNSEILFVKSVKDGIPNRDPLRDSDARRIFGEEDGRISLSDVSIKRDVRDYVQARYPNGGEQKSMFVFCREERKGNNLLGRKALADSIVSRADRVKEKEEKGMRAVLMDSAFDVRIFGIVFSVKKENFHQVGPVQFGWAHSLHPVETRYVQGTVVMPSEDVKVSDTGEESGLTQGTIWTAYTLPFAVFAMPGVINAHIAADTGMTTEDVGVLLDGLWKGTMHRQARGRGIQQPLLLLHVEYKDPFYRIGFLEESIRIEPPREQWRGDKPPTSLVEIKLNVEELAQTLANNQDQIKRVRLWQHTGVQLVGEIPAEKMDVKGVPL